MAAVVVAGLIVYFLVVRRRRPSQSSKGKPIESLHIEADRLKKDVSDKCKQMLTGKGSVPVINRNYLMTKCYFLTEIASLIGTYSRWFKDKSLPVDDDEVQRYQELIEWVRKMMS